jgi:hypothetical protein
LQKKEPVITVPFVELRLPHEKIKDSFDRPVASIIGDNMHPGVVLKPLSGILPKVPEAMRWISSANHLS